MTKNELIDRLNQLGLPKSEYWIVAGGAMVMYDLKKETRDIDLGCSTYLADFLEERGYKSTILEDGTRKITIDSDVEIFENWLYDTIIIKDDFPVISLKGLIEMKMWLGREKDLLDIELIKAYLK